MEHNYKPNSHKYKEEQKAKATEEKKIQKVVNGPVKTKKKSGLAKFADAFIAEDISSAKDYVWEEVFIPAAKKFASDALTNAIDIILYGSAGHSKKTTAANKVSYSSYYRNNDRGYRQPINRSTYSYDEIVLTTRGEAEAVIMQMDEIMSTYGLVRVADLYDLVGVTGSYTDNNYGWMDIRSARVERVRDGWLIKMPRAVPID